jgi:translation initiation factor 5A
MSLVQTSTLKVGQFLTIDGKPCKILAISTAAPGKHGSRKSMFDTKDIVTGKNVQYSSPSKGMVTVPEVTRDTYTVLNVIEDVDCAYMSLLRNGSVREDIRLPDDENGKEIRRLLEKHATPEVSIMTVMDNYIVTTVKESTDV